jgi:putative membrane protein
VITRAVPAAVLISRERTWMIIARAACPGATVAILAAVALSLILIPV